MELRIEPFTASQREAVVELSMRAWAPVFESIQASLRPDLYETFYGDDWRVAQRKDVERVCSDEAMHVWVALDGDAVAGFVAISLDKAEKMGEIYMIASDPAYQGRGVGMALTRFAEDRMREAGMTIAMVETGSDPGHAPARKLYENAGFGLWPASRYFKKL